MQSWLLLGGSGIINALCVISNECVICMSRGIVP